MSKFDISRKKYHFEKNVAEVVSKIALFCFGRANFFDCSRWVGILSEANSTIQAMIPYGPRAAFGKGTGRSKQRYHKLLAITRAQMPAGDGLNMNSLMPGPLHLSSLLRPSSFLPPSSLRPRRLRPRNLRPPATCLLRPSNFTRCPQIIFDDLRNGLQRNGLTPHRHTARYLSGVEMLTTHHCRIVGHLRKKISPRSSEKSQYFASGGKTILIAHPG